MHSVTSVIIIIIIIIYTAQDLVQGDYSKRIHSRTYTQAPAHMSMLTTYNFMYSRDCMNRSE